MAYLALKTEIVLRVVGIVCGVKIAFMTGEAVRRQGGELPAFMAAFAGDGLMRSG